MLIMNKTLLCAGIPVLLFLAGQSAFAQFGRGGGSTIQANIRGGGGDGKCTFEVEVDQAAEIEIRGATGSIRTLAGSPAVWRRLDCNAPLPSNPANFRFQGVDGRGRQDLVSNPNSNGGSAVIRIEDPKAGREGFTGDILWSGGSNNYPGGQNGGNWNNGGGGNGNWNSGGWNHNGNGGWNGNGRTISVGDAMNICQNEVSSQSGAPRDAVRVDSNGNNSNRGSYTINFQIRQRGGQGNASGSCRISRNGQIEDIRH